MRPRTLALIVIAFAVAIGGLGHCVGRRGAEASARVLLAAAEERAASAAGALTREQLSRSDAERAEAELRDELARVRAAVPSATVREVVRWRSAPMVAQGEPPTIIEPGACEPTDRTVGDTSQPPGSPCLVPSGAVLDVRVTEARVQSDAGAQALVGRAEVWRLDPPPETRIAEGPLRADLSSWRAAEGGSVDRPRRTRWAVSGEAGLSIDGPVYAGAVERRVVGPVWAGVAAGSVARVGYVAARVRVEW